MDPDDSATPPSRYALLLYVDRSPNEEEGDKRRQHGCVRLAVDMGLTAAQVVGGIVSGSLALIADALHDFSDAVSLIIAFAARFSARQRQTLRQCLRQLASV